MDGDGLAGGAGDGGRVCHAAGLHQRAAHRPHPGRGPHRRKDQLCPLLQVGRRAAREEIERDINEALFRDLETKIVAKPLIPKLRRSYRLPDGAVLEVNHVDEGQPTEFWYAEVEYPTVEAARSWQPEAVGLADYLRDEVTDQPGQSMGAYWVQTRG